MKKKLMLMMLMVLILAGCQKPQEIIEPEPVPVEQVDYYSYGDFKYSQESILAFLDGEWTLTQAPDAEKMTFIVNAEKKTAEVRRGDDFAAYATITLKPLFEGESSCYSLMELDVYNASEKTKSKFSDKFAIYKSYLQFMMVTSSGRDYLMLRESGNGLSLIDTEGFGEDAMSKDYTWTLSRMTDTVYPNKEQQEKLMKKNETFYAYLWGWTGTEAWLQHLSANELEKDMYGEKMNVLLVEPENGDVGATMIKYSLASDVTSVQFDAASSVGSIVRIITNSAGEIKKIETLQYVGEGYYRRFE